MTRAESTPHAANAEHEIVFARTFDAPPELVWRAWTEADQIARWWGPTGFSTTTNRMDVRPGGQWRFVMHGPDGTDYLNLVTYIEVVEPERLVYRHGGDPDVEPVDFTVVATFEKLVTASFDRADEAGAKTRVTLRMTFPTKAARDFAVREYGALEGAKQTLARLDEHLQASQRGREPDDAFVTSRAFRAPREVVWRAWTERERFVRWFGPKGMTISACSMDLRHGGICHYCMRGPSGGEMWGKWVFQEVAAPERLVMLASFADERGATVRAPFDVRWPLQMRSTISFEPHAGKGGGAVVTIRTTALAETEEERRTFAAARQSMQEGWSGTLDQLATFLDGAPEPE